MKTRLVFAFFFISISINAQNQYSESLSPQNMEPGVYYQVGPGGNNGTFNWRYPYGTKLSVLAGSNRQFRNFELMASVYPYGDLILRQYNPDNNMWTDWRKILVENQQGNIGVGTTNPLAKLHINNGNNSYGAILANSSESAFALYTKSLGREINTEMFRLGLKYNNTEENGFISFYRGGSSREGFLGFSTNGIERIRIDKHGDVGIGTTDTKGFKLGVNGKVAAAEVKVALYNNWSDFVFYDNYKLPTLKEVENYIKEKGHLKDIPSAKEVEKNGIFLGEMNAKLLQKIEELTLYTIQQEKEIERQKEEILELKKLEERIKKLESRD